MLDLIINWLKLSKPCRIDLRGYYCTKDHEQTASYAKKNISIVGVKELSEQLENEYKNYLQEIGNIINAEDAKESEKYNQWEKISKIKNIFKYSAIALFLFTILFMVLKSNLCAISFPFLLVVILIGSILKVIDVMREKKYCSYARSVIDKFRSINGQYVHIFNVIYKDIDNLYLNSLEPAHREMVLMRRDQERQHQEAMRANERQAEMQRKIAEEQQQLRIQQEELLKIEKEREQRYGRY